MSLFKQHTARHRAQTSSRAVRTTTVVAAAGAALVGSIAPAQAYAEIPAASGSSYAAPASAMADLASYTTPAPVAAPSGPVAPVALARYDGATVWRARFALPADRASTYDWDGQRFEVAGDLTGDLRLAYVSCNGEEVGDGSGAAVDVAVDPIDGTRLTAMGYNNALSVFAVAERGTMFDPSAVFYMDKLVVGPEAADLVDLRLPVKQNVHLVAKAKGVKANQVTVCVLDRPRHQGLVDEIRATGARTRMILDGDVAGAIAACREGTGVDMMMGIGGTPEGIVTACAIKATGGIIQGRLAPIDDDERQRAIDAGHDLDRVLTTDDLVTTDNCFFAATGITDGDLLRGVRFADGRVHTQSIVMRSSSGTVRTVDAEHDVKKWSKWLGDRDAR